MKSFLDHKISLRTQCKTAVFSDDVETHVRSSHQGIKKARRDCLRRNFERLPTVKTTADLHPLPEDLAPLSSLIPPFEVHPLAGQLLEGKGRRLMSTGQGTAMNYRSVIPLSPCRSSGGLSTASSLAVSIYYTIFSITRTVTCGRNFTDQQGRLRGIEGPFDANHRTSVIIEERSDLVKTPTHIGYLPMSTPLASLQDDMTRG
jgi:hypothetical protein